MTGIVERRPGLSFDILEARVILRRKIQTGNGEISRIAEKVLSDPELFARFVELRRQNRAARMIQAAMPPEPRWYDGVVSWCRRLTAR